MAENCAVKVLQSAALVEALQIKGIGPGDNVFNLEISPVHYRRASIGTASTCLNMALHTLKTFSIGYVKRGWRIQRWHFWRLTVTLSPAAQQTLLLTCGQRSGDIRLCCNLQWRGCCIYVTLVSFAYPVTAQSPAPLLYER